MAAMNALPVSGNNNSEKSTVNAGLRQNFKYSNPSMGASFQAPPTAMIKPASSPATPA